MSFTSSSSSAQPQLKLATGDEPPPGSNTMGHVRMSQVPKAAVSHRSHCCHISAGPIFRLLLNIWL